MHSETLARRYATAIFTLASNARAVDRVGRDLKSVAQAIYGNDDVRRFYLSPVFERKKKETLLLAAFEGKIHEIALHALLLLVRKRREALLRAISIEYGKLALAAAGKEPLEIVSARPLDKKAVAAIVARAEADARRLRDRILAEATAEGARLLQNAEGELERGRAAARDELRASLVAKALGIAREASRGLDARTDRRLIEQTVAVADRDAQR